MYIQTCNKKSPLEQGKSDCLIQVTSYKDSSHMDFLITGREYHLSIQMIA